MTGYTVHTGSNKQFTEGWDRIFPGAKIRSSVAKSTASKKAASKSAKKTGKGK